MILIGEKLNSSIPRVQAAFEAQDEAFLLEAARSQLEAGADYLDLNAALFLEKEADKLSFALELLLKAFPQAKFMLDTPNPAAAKTVLSRFSLDDVILNSISLEENRYQGMLELISQYNLKAVLMPIASTMPESVEERVENALRLAEQLKEAGMSYDNMFVDVLVEAVAGEYTAASRVLKTIGKIKQALPQVHTTGGLSNISFGLPGRVRMNAFFLSHCMAAGLDSAILDAANPEIRYALALTSLFQGEDEYCMDYITLYRELTEA